MIQINGLTKEQVQMLDFMWNELDTEEDYLIWFSTLNGREQKMAEVLMRMVIIESLEYEEDLGDMEEAKMILEKYRI